MIFDPLPDSNERSPLKILLITIVLTLAGLAWVAWSIYSVSFRDDQIRYQWMHEIGELQGRITYLDEVLTMSARMAVETGDKSWEHRYRKNEPVLASAIERAHQLVLEQRDTNDVAKVKEANTQLVALEEQAFALIRQGKSEKARQMLFSPQYSKQKEIYSAAMASFHRSLHGAVDQVLAEQARTHRAQILTILGIVLFLCFGWINVYRTLGRWRSNVDREVRLRQQLLETTQEGFWEVSPDGTTLDVNDAMCRILGRPRQDIIGKNIYDFVDKENAAILNGEIAVRKQGRSDAYEIQLTRPDGSTVYCLINPTPLIDEQGVHIGSVGMFSDISHLKEITRKLARSAIDAQIANKAKSNLMSNVGHELRTPLNAILGFSDAMKGEIFGPLGNQKYKEYLGDIYGSGEHLLGLINNILDISALDSSSLHLQEKNVYPFNVLNICVRLVQPRLDEANVSFESFIDSDIPLICGDEQRIKQIMLNLLNNAIKFTPAGGRIAVSWSMGIEGSLSIAVEDTGIGMTDDEIETALSTFGQVETGLDRRHEGTGLGLPLTKKLVELHEGTLEISSQKGRGTTVCVVFPEHRVVDDFWDRSLPAMRARQ